jgi:uncharacterized protein (TIGR00299 family) protein
MKTLYLDTFSGISGDMFLGLLVDLGVPLAGIENELRKLPVSGYRLGLKRLKRQAVRGAKVNVECEEHHHHRTWADIDRMLADSPLEDKTRELARRIFRRIGEAEAKIHGLALKKVHFHEVGAIDSIVDVVGAAVGLQLLGTERIVCSPLPMTRGTICCAHGSFPLPAPATLEILKGLPVVADPAEIELVTPTGAAIVAETATFGPMPAMTVTAIGYGAGDRNLADRPNLLRGILGETEEVSCLDQDRVTILESHLDDANPEWLGALMENLLQAGALDVGFSPLQMKKNRPGLRLTVVAPPLLTAILARQILRESSSAGVRWYETGRYKLRNQTAAINTPLGEASVKLFFEGEELLRAVPEYESCRKLAIDSGKSLPEVYRIVDQAASGAFSKL